MPEPKKPRRTFAVQSPSVLNRIQLLEQRGRSAENGDPANPLETNHSALEANAPEPALVEKLIKFIKTI
ncbi:MAG: hypothetical protein IH586_23345 [Anaerolineaceae bacterium]|nr:hypothetical protein [Anaerolineaceae bacterium]